MLETTPKAKPCNPSKIRKGKAFQVTRPRISALRSQTLEGFLRGNFFAHGICWLGRCVFVVGGGEGASDFFMEFLPGKKENLQKNEVVEFILGSHVQVSETPKSTAKAN